MPRGLQFAVLALAALTLAAASDAARGRTIETTPARVQGIGLEGGRLFWVLDRCTDVLTRPLATGVPRLLGTRR